MAQEAFPPDKVITDSNQYYRYSGHRTDIALWAVNTLSDTSNNIVLGLFERSENQWIDITLTEQEQDDLIAGILERRGINSHNILGIGGYIDKMHITGTSIEADNQVQSLIHPAKIS